MDVRTEIRYQGTTVPDVVALAHDPEFRAAVCRATMAVRHEVDIQVEDDGSTVVTVSRTMPNTVPDFVRRLVGGTLVIVQVESWWPDDGSGQRLADLSLHVVGQPASMRGQLVVESAPDGVLEVVDAELQVSLPLIGRRFESELARGVMAAARREQEIGQEWLSR